MKIAIDAVLYLSLCTHCLAIAAHSPKTGICVKEVFQHHTPIDTDATRFFDFVRYSDLYVDKSLLVKEIMERDDKIVVITRPRKWGKSLNLDMIKSFLQMEMKPDGNHTDPKETNSYKYFKHGHVVMDNGDVQKLKNPPLISKYDSFIEENLGKHPVIYFNFANVTGTRIEKLEYRIGEMMSDTYELHRYVEGHLIRRYDAIEVLYESEYTPERAEFDNKLREYRNMLFGMGFSEDAFARSVQFLSEVLHDMHGKKVIVIVDGYDTTINEMMFRNFKSKTEDDERMLNFFANFVKYSFKNNSYVAKGIFVGVSSLADEPYFSKYHDRTDYNMINNDLCEYYGFTQREFDAMSRQLNLSPELSERAQDWYSGYKIGSHKEPIYTPWSVVNFLNTRKVQDYWAVSGGINFFSNMLKYEDFRSVSESLLRSKNVSVNFNYLHFKKFDLLTMKHLVQDETHRLDRRTIDLILTYLCTIGYLTFDEDVYKNSVEKSERIRLRVPNKEIMNELSNLVVDFYANPANKYVR